MAAIAVNQMYSPGLTPSIAYDLVLLYQYATLPGAPVGTTISLVTLYPRRSLALPSQPGGWPYQSDAAADALLTLATSRDVLLLTCSPSTGAHSGFHVGDTVMVGASKAVILLFIDYDVGGSKAVLGQYQCADLLEFVVPLAAIKVAT